MTIVHEILEKKEKKSLIIGDRKDGTFFSNTARCLGSLSAMLDPKGQAFCCVSGSLYIFELRLWKSDKYSIMDELDSFLGGSARSV